MASTTSIVKGYGWSRRVTVDAVGDDIPFPEGCELRAQFRPFIGSPTVLATLTTENGGITRVSNTEVDLVLDGDTTGEFPIRRAISMDFVRTDTDAPTYLGFPMRVQVENPVTSMNAEPTPTFDVIVTPSPTGVVIELDSTTSLEAIVVPTPSGVNIAF